MVLAIELPSTNQRLPSGPAVRKFTWLTPLSGTSVTPPLGSTFAIAWPLAVVTATQTLPSGPIVSAPALSELFDKGNSVAVPDVPLVTTLPTMLPRLYQALPEESTTRSATVPAFPEGKATAIFEPSGASFETLELPWENQTWPSDDGAIAPTAPTAADNVPTSAIAPVRS